MKIELGDEAKCKITGFQGIVVETSQHLTGCDRAGLRAPMKKDGTLGECYAFDVSSLKIIKKGKVKSADVQESESKLKKVGGPPTRLIR